jgi:predicted nucleotidyltransferase
MISLFPMSFGISSKPEGWLWYSFDMEFSDSVRGDMTHSTDRGLRIRYLDQITSILSQALRNKNCEVYLFGSRAVGDHAEASDVDIAVLATEDVSRELSVARERLESSHIPFTVDVVDLNTTSEQFARQVQERGILLWKN